MFDCPLKEGAVLPKWERHSHGRLFRLFPAILHSHLVAFFPKVQEGQCPIEQCFSEAPVQRADQGQTNVAYRREGG